MLTKLDLIFFPTVNDVIVIIQNTKKTLAEANLDNNNLALLYLGISKQVFAVTKDIMLINTMQSLSIVALTR